jgi:RNA polymerase sigma-70 factor (ECF subfamily)
MERSDDELVTAIARVDERAFTALYRRHLPAVTSFHLRRTGDRELAFDLTAETFAAVVVAAPRFDPARGSAAGWVFGIAANKLRESARRGRIEADARERLRLEPIAVDDDDLERVERLAGEGDGPLMRLLDELPPDQRTAIAARVVDERPYEDIAAELRCSEAVVRQRVSRGLARLRERLREVTA